MEAHSLTKFEPVAQQDEVVVTGKHLIRATACSYPPVVHSDDVLLVDADCMDIGTDGIYLLERIDAGRVVWMGCRRFELSVTGEVRIDESGDGQLCTFDADARSRYRIAGRVMQIYKPSIGNSKSAIQIKQKESTYHPIVGLCDGTITRMAGGMSHDEALTAAEIAARSMKHVDFVGAGQDRSV